MNLEDFTTRGMRDSEGAREQAVDQVKDLIGKWAPRSLTLGGTERLAREIVKGIFEGELPAKYAEMKKRKGVV